MRLIRNIEMPTILTWEAELYPLHKSKWYSWLRGAPNSELPWLSWTEAEIRFELGGKKYSFHSDEYSKKGIYRMAQALKKVDCIPDLEPMIANDKKIVPKISRAYLDTPFTKFLSILLILFILGGPIYIILHSIIEKLFF